MAEECRSDGYNIPRPEHTCTCTYDCFMSRLSKYLGHLGVWGELTSHKRLFNPPLQLGIIYVSLWPIFLKFFLLCLDMTDCMPLFVCVGMIVWAFFPSYYTLSASVLCTCISMYLHSCQNIPL